MDGGAGPKLVELLQGVGGLGAEHLQIGDAAQPELIDRYCRSTAETAVPDRGDAGAQALGLDSEVGSLVPGKRADLAVVSLAGSSYLPWEDPAGGVVFGGSPDRVVATYVGGELRYERGGMDWQELTAAARSARRAMLAPPAVRPVAAPHA